MPGRVRVDFIMPDAMNIRPPAALGPRARARGRGRRYTRRLLGEASQELQTLQTLRLLPEMPPDPELTGDELEELEDLWDCEAYNERVRAAARASALQGPAALSYHYY
jgi:hypothetical protein